jgi:hypothetical protein
MFTLVRAPDTAEQIVVWVLERVAGARDHRVDRTDAEPRAEQLLA